MGAIDEEEEEDLQITGNVSCTVYIKLHMGQRMETGLYYESLLV